jgi:hypothetical protein
MPKMNFLFLRCFGILLFLIWTAMPALAQVSLKTRQYLLLSGPENTASFQFAHDLAEIWSMPGVSSGSDLQPIPFTDGAARLEQMRDQRGHLAIINGQEAWQLLPQHPQVKVVSTLWPNVLYLISRLQPPQIVPLTAVRSVRAPLQALEVIKAWDELSPVPLFQETNWFRHEETIQALEEFKEDIFLSWGSYPLQEIRALLNFPGYYLTEAQNTLQKIWTQQLPWTHSYTLPAETYAGQPALQLLAEFPVLVVHETVPDSLVDNLLRNLFGHAESSNPRFLFRHISPQHNLLFQKKLPYHSVARRFYRFP